MCVCLCKVTVTAVTRSFCQVWLTVELHHSENLMRQTHIHVCKVVCWLLPVAFVKILVVGYFGLSFRSEWHAVNTIT